MNGVRENGIEMQVTVAVDRKIDAERQIKGGDDFELPVRFDERRHKGNVKVNFDIDPDADDDRTDRPAVFREFVIQPVAPDFVNKADNQDNLDVYLNLDAQRDE